MNFDTPSLLQGEACWPCSSHCRFNGQNSFSEMLNHRGDGNLLVELTILRFIQTMGEVSFGASPFATCRTNMEAKPSLNEEERVSTRISAPYKYGS